MIQENKYRSSKGGRPLKPVKRNQALTVKCSIIERKALEKKAGDASLTVSEYLRSMGLSGKIDRREKSIPAAILDYKGTLNGMAANLNQVVKKNNCNEVLTGEDRLVILGVAMAIKEHVIMVVKYYQ